MIDDHDWKWAYSRVKEKLACVAEVELLLDVVESQSMPADVARGWATAMAANGHLMLETFESGDRSESLYWQMEGF